MTHSVPQETESQFSLDFPYALGKPEWSGILKAANADFVVQEIFPESFSNDGEHHYVLVEKDGENSHWVARLLAEYCNVDVSAVGLAGLKDRYAVTQQWFSVQLPGQAKMDWSGFNSPNYKILKAARHHKKLRRGDHLGNRFIIVIRDIDKNAAQADLEQRLSAIKYQGVPNYFGEQRFGISGENLVQAQAWFQDGKRIKNRKQKSFVLSAARSYLFNVMLAKRVVLSNWQQAIPGDVLDSDYPSGPMWGRGRLASQDDALLLERALEEEYSVWCDALEHQGLKQERRPLVLMPANLSWRWQDDALELSFQLPPGQFATAVLRELFNYRELNRHG